MLDNGYVYLAAPLLSLFSAPCEWALVIEVFGFSPREGAPSTAIYTFASQLRDRDSLENYVSEAAYRRYLTSNPNNEMRSVFPVEEAGLLDEGDGEFVSNAARVSIVRGQAITMPTADDYARIGVIVDEPDHVRVADLCRYLASVARDQVLCTEAERRGSVPPELAQILQLEEWTHPNVVDSKVRPSRSACFQQLAEALVTGNPSAYRPTSEPNTHWKHWPDGGTL